MRMLVFMAVMTAIWIGGHIYIGRRLFGRLGLSTRLRRLAWIGLSLSGSTAMAALWASRIGGGSSGLRTLQWVGLWLFGLTSVLFFLVLFSDIVGGAAKGMRKVLSSANPTPPDDPGRRGFIGKVASMGAMATSGGVGGVGLAQAMQLPEVVEVEVPIDGLPEAFDGYRIVQLSDVHVGPTIRREHLEAIVERANGLDGDLAVVTGDLVDGYVDDLRDEVAPLAGFRGRDGAYFVTGNHEYYWDGPAWCDEVARLGLGVLNNEHRVISRGGARLLLAGCTDVKAGDLVPEHASDPAGARAGAPPCDVSILLAHQPRSIDAASVAGYDLQLSGHTHGGQYFPFSVLVHLAQPYVAGLAKHDKTWIYVSRGTGYWGPPMRVGAPHEITLVTLRRA
ncbi:MAG: metallophosphoesterase [Nannocystales bacterium]